jgi:predicted transcriptional regulator
MGMIQLSDALQREVDRQVAEGHAASVEAFVHEAVMRLVDDARAEREEIEAVVAAGIADIEAGRYTLISTDEDRARVEARIMDRVKARLSSGL